MPRFRRVPVTVLDRPVPPKVRHPDPAQLALVARLRTIRSEADAYEVRLEPGERPSVIRQRIMRAAKVAGVDIVAHPAPAGGFYIGLATPSRRWRGGRRPTAV